MLIRYYLTLLCYIAVPNVYAQLCTGSLGDPVVNLTFGAGPNPGAPLSAATTNYGFVNGDCPNDGYYTVRNNTTACFGNSWHSLTKDHTGDPNGYFMLVNASIDTSDFYLDTVRGLCPNTTFEFAAWVVNVLLPSACSGMGKTPNLTFYIQSLTGDTLQKFNSGNISSSASPEWKQYGFFFKTGIESDVVVSIKNNEFGGCGNDLALDDITFRPCGPTVNTTISASTTTKDLALCDYQTNNYTINATVSQGYINPAYQWQVSTDSINWTDIAGATTLTYIRKPTVKGIYYYRIAAAEAGNINSAKCRIVSNAVVFRVESKPVTSTSSNSPVCEGTTLTLNASGGSTYLWSGPDDYVATGTPATINNVQQKAAGKYIVVVSSAAGCVQYDSVFVTVIKKPLADAGADTNICEGATVMLNGSGGNTYTWSPATGLSATDIPNPLASPVDSTIYTLMVTNAASGCNSTDSVAIFVSKAPVANAGTDKVMIEGESAQLSGSASGSAVTYNWTPATFINDANSLTPIVSPPEDATYTLHVTSLVGCGTATDVVFVKVYKKVLIPNAFSPNGDGINDIWRIGALDTYPDAVITVFNRNGQPVFISKGSYTPWDGTYNKSPLPIGTYYYMIDVKFGLPKLKGWVTILR